MVAFTLEDIEWILSHNENVPVVTLVYDDRWNDSIKVKENIMAIFEQYANDTVVVLVNFDSEATEEFRKMHTIIYPPVVFLNLRGMIPVSESFLRVEQVGRIPSRIYFVATKVGYGCAVWYGRDASFENRQAEGDSQNEKKED